MKIKNWKYEFSPLILERGEAYYLDGAVESLEIEGNVVTAEVFGSELYDVELEIENGALADASCTCPYAEDGNYCKHMAAVLYALAEEAAEPDPPEAANRALAEQIAALTETQAKDLLLIVAGKHRDAAELIEAMSAGTVSKAQRRRWEEEIRDLTYDAGGDFGYIDYDQAWAYTEALIELLDERVPVLLASGQTEDAFSLICTAFTEANSVEMDDSDGGLSLLFARCAELWSQVLQVSDRDQRRTMHAWFVRAYTDKALDFGQDAVGSVLFEAFDDEAILRENLKLLDRLIEQDGEHSRYYQEHLISLRLKTMEKLSADRKEIDAYLARNHAYPVIRDYMVQRFLREKQFDSAVDLLRKGIDMDKELPGLVCEHREALIDLYRQLGRTEEQREAVLALLKKHWQRDLDYIEMLKGLTDPADWPALREELLTWKSLRSVANRLLEAEGLHGRLLDRLIEEGSMYEMDQFEKTLRPLYPEKLLAFYLSCLREEMAQASKRSAYAGVIRRLKGLRKYPKGEAEARRLAGEWRKAYPRRRAMLDELRIAGY